MEPAVRGGQRPECRARREPPRKRKGTSGRAAGGWNSSKVRAAWHAQGPQARPGVEGRQQLGRRVPHSLPGVQPWLRGGPQTLTPRRNLQRACGQQAGSRRVSVLNCPPCHRPLTLLAAPPASTVPFSFPSPSLSLLLCHRKAQKVSAGAFFTARLGRLPRLPRCANWALAELPVGRATLFCTFLKERGRHRTLQTP